MLIEGIMLYLLIIEVYNNELKLRLCYSFSFGKSLEEAQVKAEKTVKYSNKADVFMTMENAFSRFC